MPQDKLTNEERREKRKLAERARMEKIRKDPEKYAIWQMKMREAYLKKKKEGKIVSVRDLTPKEQKIARKKSRESTRRWFERKKLKERIQSEEEIIEAVKTENDTIYDPLSLPSQETIEVSIPPRSTKSPSPIIPASVSSKPLKMCSPKTYAPVSPKRRVLSLKPTVSDLPNLSTMRSAMTFVPDLPICLKIRSPESSVTDSPRSLSVRTPISPISNSPRSLSPQSSASITPTRFGNPERRQRAQRKMTVKKKSSWKHLLRNLKYRYKKELRIKDQQIAELKRINEKYRKKLHRLRSLRKLKDMQNQHKQKRQETDYYISTN